MIDRVVPPGSVAHDQDVRGMPLQHQPPRPGARAAARRWATGSKGVGARPKTAGASVQWGNLAHGLGKSGSRMVPNGGPRLSRAAVRTQAGTVGPMQDYLLVEGDVPLTVRGPWSTARRQTR